MAIMYSYSLDCSIPHFSGGFCDSFLKFQESLSFHLVPQQNLLMTLSYSFSHQVQLWWCRGQANCRHAAWQAKQCPVCCLLHLCRQSSPGTLWTSWQMQKVGACCWLPEARIVGIWKVEVLMNATLCSSFSRACIASRDPYCGWVKESGVCTQLVLGSKWVRALAEWAWSSAGGARRSWAEPSETWGS